MIKYLPALKMAPKNSFSEFIISFIKNSEEGVNRYKIFKQSLKKIE
jgi:hypothetical protein